MIRDMIHPCVMSDVVTKLDSTSQSRPTYPTCKFQDMYIHYKSTMLLNLKNFQSRTC